MNMILNQCGEDTDILVAGQISWRKHQHNKQKQPLQDMLFFFSSHHDETDQEYQCQAKSMRNYFSTKIMHLKRDQKKRVKNLW